jgi:RapZ C-terminal domain
MTKSTDLENILILYPHAIQNEDMYTVNVIKNIYAVFDLLFENYYSYDDKGNDYTEKLKDIVDFVKSLNGENNATTILQYYADQFRRIAGFDDCNNCDTVPGGAIQALPDYNSNKDVFWKIMKNKYNINENRKIRIVTYGTRFIKIPVEKCEKIYNAVVLRAKNINPKTSYNILVKLRGTNPKIQHEVRSAELFEQFINTIVSDIEKNNYSCIGIICTAGHHRSVACAEMLKKLYKNIKCEHMTINKK